MKTSHQNEITSLWEKLYSYARRRGRRHHDAEDFAQDLFAKLFTNGVLERFMAIAESAAHVDSLVFATARRLLIDQERRKKAIKRGGGEAGTIEIEEEMCAAEPTNNPDQALAFKETLSVIEESEARLRAEYCAAGKDRVFDLLKDCLFSHRSGIESRTTADALGVKPGTLRVNVSRMRSRFREMVAVELAA